MTLNTQTKIGLTFGQVITLITYTGLVVSLYFSVVNRISIIERENMNRAITNEKLINTVDRIDRTLIRFEGKLDLKKDKSWQ